ncbi:MAG: hypothetical protein IJ165_07595 [Proteobacteria bacterium]|nr:hypothetical protein [Pseudomonadota bacterium]
MYFLYDLGCPFAVSALYGIHEMPGTLEHLYGFGPIGFCNSSLHVIGGVWIIAQTMARNDSTEAGQWRVMRGVSQIAAPDTRRIADSRARKNRLKKKHKA